MLTGLHRANKLTATQGHACFCRQPVALKIRGGIASTLLCSVPALLCTLYNSGIVACSH